MRNLLWPFVPSVIVMTALVGTIGAEEPEANQPDVPAEYSKVLDLARTIAAKESENKDEDTASVSQLMQLGATMTIVDGEVIEVRFPPSLTVKMPDPQQPILDPRWAHGWIREYGIIRLTGRAGRQFSREPVNDDDLRPLDGLERVTLVDARFTNITDKGLKELQRLPVLQRLDISATQITGQGLSRLDNCEMLQALFAGGMLIDDGFLTFLEKCPNLEVLNLSGSRIDSEAIPRIAKLKKLRKLFLPGCSIHDDDVRELAAIQPLEQLDIAATQVSSIALTALSGHPNLRHITISKSVNDIEQFRRQNPQVEVNIVDDIGAIFLPLLKGNPE